MKLVLLLFSVSGLFLTSQALAKSKKTAKIVCKCNLCMVEGKVERGSFKGYVEHVGNRLVGAALPKWSRNHVKGLLLTQSINVAELAANCAAKKFSCQIMILQCDNKGYHKRNLKPQAGPAEPAPNPIIKTGIRLTVRQEEEGCV